MRVVLAIKRTALASGGRTARLAGRGQASAETLLQASDAHERSLLAVREAFRSALQYRVRELYREPGRRYRLIHGFVSPGRSLEIVSRMPEGRLHVDGWRAEHAFLFGTRAVFRTAAEDLRIVLP